MRLTFIAGSAAVLALTASVLSPTIAAAQPGGVGPACSIDPNSPKELALQALAFQQARSAADPASRKRVLTGVMKELDTKPERFAKNPAGYNYVLAEALKLWAVEPGVGATPTRGQLGFVTNPEQPYDIVVNLDSALRKIEAAAPTCAGEVANMRQSDAWLALTRAALDASNGGKLDSAEYYAKRSLILSETNPYPHYVLANVANARNEREKAIGFWKTAIERAGKDTTYNELRLGSMYYVAMSQLELAQAKTGAEQQTIAREAAGTFKSLLAESPNSTDAANLINGWADALTLAKDTAQIPSVYQGLLAEPAKYSDLTLTMAGVIATRANRTDDAIKLFEAAVAKNGTSRDALRNLAATYYGKDQFSKMFEPTKKLLAVDPNNYDGWMMYAYASQGLGKAAKTPVERKAWTDSLVKYQSIAEKLPVKVDVAGFQRGAQSATLTLALQQVLATPGQYSVMVEFLDASGNVVTSATEQVGPIKKGETKQLVVKGSGAGIQGYRYKPIG